MPIHASRKKYRGPSYYKLARVVEGVVKAKGSWVTLDTPAQKVRVLPSSSSSTATLKNLHAFKNIFLFVRTDLSHCTSLKAIVMVYAETTLLFQCGTTSLYIHWRKIHQNNKPLLRAFSVLIQNICRPINVFQQAQRGFHSPYYLFHQEAKM